MLTLFALLSACEVASYEDAMSDLIIAPRIEDKCIPLAASFHLSLSLFPSPPSPLSALAQRGASFPKKSWMLDVTGIFSVSSPHKVAALSAAAAQACRRDAAERRAAHPPLPH